MKDFKQFNEDIHQPTVDNTTTPPGVKETKIDNITKNCTKLNELLLKDNLSDPEKTDLRYALAVLRFEVNKRI